MACANGGGDALAQGEILLKNTQTASKRRKKPTNKHIVLLDPDFKNIAGSINRPVSPNVEGNLTHGAFKIQT